MVRRGAHRTGHAESAVQRSEVHASRWVRRGRACDGHPGRRDPGRPALGRRRGGRDPGGRTRDRVRQVRPEQQDEERRRRYRTRAGDLPGDTAAARWHHLGGQHSRCRCAFHVRTAGACGRRVRSAGRRVMPATNDCGVPAEPPCASRPQVAARRFVKTALRVLRVFPGGDRQGDVLAARRAQVRCARAGFPGRRGGSMQYDPEEHSPAPPGSVMSMLREP